MVKVAMNGCFCPMNGLCVSHFCEDIIEINCVEEIENCRATNTLSDVRTATRIKKEAELQPH